LSEDFTVILQGEYIETLEYNDTLNNMTPFEALVINDYLNSGIDDYNSLILRKYTISKTIYRDLLKNGAVDKIKINYKILWGEDSFKKANVYNYAKIISNNILDMHEDNYEKISKIHDYIINNFSYDTINTKENYIHTPSEMISSKYGVCSAYTGLFTAFLDVNNIENRVIIKDAFSNNFKGENVPHTWNLINLYDVWYHIDVTWDDPIGKFSSKTNYFLKSDEFMKKEHIWDDKVYPNALYSYEDKGKTPHIAAVSSSKKDKIIKENSTSIISFSGEMIFKKAMDIILNANFIIGLLGIFSLLFLTISIFLQLRR
ncbi:MAG: transglutaminase domain-containing protein, partial [Clostridia bacterium]